MLEFRRETQPAPAQPVMPYGFDLAMHVQNLTCNYGKKVAVDNVSLHVPVGSVYGFLGPNGAGKTTTIKTLIGLRPIQAGRVNMLGMDLATSPERIRARVGYMSETSNLYRFMRVKEIVEVARRLSKRWNAASVQHYLDLFNLPPKAKVQSLSKGQKGQLALTLALGSEPDLLILDEPTSGLDPLKRFEFLNQIVREVSQSGRTIFFSSHNLSEVEQIADRVAILNEGKLIVEDELDNLRLHQKSIKVSFDQPVWAYELETILGVKQVMQEGRRFRLMVRGEVEMVAAELRKLGASHIQIVDMNLEAMFVAYLQGYKADR
jgi:ABC-2 type transport system ATP-binding protein